MQLGRHHGYLVGRGRILNGNQFMNGYNKNTRRLLSCGLFALCALVAAHCPAAVKGVFPDSSGPIEIQQKFQIGTEEGVSLYCAAKTDSSGAVSLAVLMDSPTSQAVNTAGWSRPGSVETVTSPPCDGYLGVDFQISCAVDNGGLYQATRRCVRDSKSILGVSAADYGTTAHLGLEKDLRNAFVSWWGGVYGEEKGVYQPPTYLHPDGAK